MTFNRVLNEAPANLSQIDLTKWNVEQIKFWKTFEQNLKEKYSFIEFAKKFDSLYRHHFEQNKDFPSYQKMIRSF